MCDNAHADKLTATAKHLLRRGRGLLAADESTGTIGKRLMSHNIDNTAETRRKYRQILILADNADAYSGVILHDETIRQRTDCGKLFTDVLLEKGIIPGIKVDCGLRPLQGSERETETTGLEGVADRCEEYYEMGARFTKWRAAIRIDEANGLPTRSAIETNAKQLAEYARVVQRAGMVAIVEPEVLIEGNHDIQTAAKVGRDVIGACVKEMHGVVLKGVIFKVMMAVPGGGAGGVDAKVVAEESVQMVKDVIPKEVAGVVFLSGGMSEVEATRNLAAVCSRAREEKIGWGVSFSFGRALQMSVLKVWKGREENAREAMMVARELGIVNARALVGEVEEGRHPGEGGRLYEAFRGWSGGAGV